MANKSKKYIVRFVSGASVTIIADTIQWVEGVIRLYGEDATRPVAILNIHEMESIVEMSCLSP